MVARSVYVMLMFVFASAVGPAVGHPTTAGEAADLREFRNQQGRAIQARVVRVRGDQVTIERADGKQFTVAISIFSQADQEYIRNRNRSRGRNRKTKPGVEVRRDWPSFRGPGGMGVSDSRGLPVQWDPSRNIVWKTKLPGSGASSPITMGDHIYVTCYTGYFVPGEPPGRLEQLRRHLLALDRDTGAIVWDRAIPAKLPEEKRIRDHGYAANTPAADADRVYAFFGKSGVFAFDHQGQPLWQADVGTFTSGWGTSASPVLYKDTVIINASVESQSLVALDRRTGAVKWRLAGINEAWNTPILVTPERGRQELVVARRGALLGVDPERGQGLWSCRTDIEWYMVPSGVAADGVVYYLGGRSGTAALAVRAGGRGDVTAQRRLWTSKHGSNVTSPLYWQGHLYWMSEKLGIAYCAKADSGQLVYQQRLQRAGQVYASPILADGRIYYLTRDGQTIVVPARPKFEQLAVNDLSDGSRFDASPAVDGSRLLIRSGKHLYCVGHP